MARLIKNTANNYTNISNKVVRDERLSWKARGIFLYMWSQADNWQFYVSEIAKHATDGERSLQSGLKELENYGYLTRKHRIGKNGDFSGMDWILTDDPEKTVQNSIDAKKAENQRKNLQNASDAKRTRCKTHPMQNSALRNNNNKKYQYQELSTVSNKDTSPKKSYNAEVREVIEYLNEKAGKEFKPTASGNRSAIIPRLKEGYTVSQLKKVIDNKVIDWKGITFKNGQLGDNYLRPKTLFAPTNIEGYLTETPHKNTRQANQQKWQKESQEFSSDYAF